MKRHAFDSISFISGLVATLIGLLFLIPQDPSDLFEAVGNIGGFFWPLLLLGIGVAVLLPLVLGRGDQETGSEETGEDLSA